MLHISERCPKQLGTFIMSELSSFPLFSQLPVELRVMVWKYFALPKGPVFYLLTTSLRPTKPSELPKWHCYLRHMSHPFMHLETMSSAWNLMHINKEAREIILNGRQVLGVAASEYSGKGMGILELKNSSSIITRIDCQVIFVNWEEDIFCYPMIIHTYQPTLVFNLMRSDTYQPALLYDLVDFNSYQRSTLFDPINFTKPKILFDQTDFRKRIVNLAFDLSDIVSMSSSLQGQQQPTEISSFLERATESLSDRFYPYLAPDLESLCRVQFVVWSRSIQKMCRGEDSEALASWIDHMKWSPDACKETFPISMEKLTFALAKDPQLYKQVQKFCRSLKVSIDEFTHKTSTIISKKCQRKVDVHLVIDYFLPFFD
ncbi:hypothetical protein M426DRAFT_226859 [Hypoxylon sp. CI-4A]|nr:hypothetical protein M426DRAFT_226859 [Hypoxylon sp. CI-4A]